MNSSMVKPEKFGHLHLVYHFTIPLSKHVGKSSKSTKGELFFKEFFNTFEDIGK